MSELLSNFDIMDICKSLNIRLNKCGYKSDLFGSCLNGGYIINLDKAGGQGTHWVALFVDGDNCCYYDSFGMIYPNEIKGFCKNKFLIYNENDNQYITDEHCGWFSIAFLYFMQNNKNKNISDKLDEFDALFSSTNPKLNLTKLQGYFKTIYKPN